MTQIETINDDKFHSLVAALVIYFQAGNNDNIMGFGKEEILSYFYLPDLIFSFDSSVNKSRASRLASAIFNQHIFVIGNSLKMKFNFNKEYENLISATIPGCTINALQRYFRKYQYKRQNVG